MGYLGEVVDDGEPFQPGPDPCVSCVCDDGVGTRCRSIACMPPTTKSGEVCRLVPGTCCDFQCANAQELGDIERGTTSHSSASSSN